MGAVFVENCIVLMLNYWRYAYVWSCVLNSLVYAAAVLGRLPGTTVYRNIQQYPEAYTYNGIVIVRIDAPIYFANISYIKDRWKLVSLKFYPRLSFSFLHL